MGRSVIKAPRIVAVCRRAAVQQLESWAAVSMGRIVRQKTKVMCRLRARKESETWELAQCGIRLRTDAATIILARFWHGMAAK